MDFECSWTLLNMPTWFLDHFDHFLAPFGAVLRVVSGTFRAILGTKIRAFWGDFGPVLGRSGVILGSRRDHFGIVLASFSGCFGIVLASFWGCFGIVSASFSGVFSGVFELFGRFWGPF